MSHIPQPKPVQLDYFDPNIVVGLVEEPESIESAEKEGRKVTKNTFPIANTPHIALYIVRILKDVQNHLAVSPVKETTIRWISLTMH